jgi:hypothetical protein
MNVTHKPFDGNTIYLDQIIDRLSSYTPTNFQQLSLRNFHLSEKLMSLENRQTQNRQLQMIITFDPLNEIQRSLMRWKALTEALLSTPPLPIWPHNQITRSQNLHGLINPKK